MLKVEYLIYSSSELSTKSTTNSPKYVKIPRDYSVILFLNSYPDLNFDVVQTANHRKRYAENYDKRLDNLGPTALNTNYKLSTSSGKPLEDISQAHFVCLM